MRAFCTTGDISAINQQRDYSATSKPSITQVEGFILNRAAEISLAVRMAGYNLTDLYSIDDAATGAITAGSTVSVTVTDGTQFAIGDSILLDGFNSTGGYEFEIQPIQSITTNTLVFATIANGYVTGANLTVLTENMKFLRLVNQLGASADAEIAAFMGVSPNQSEHGQILLDQYNGYLNLIKSEPGIFAAIDADKKIIKRSTISSYTEQNSDDEILDTKISIANDRW